MEMLLKVFKNKKNALAAVQEEHNRNKVYSYLQQATSPHFIVDYYPIKACAVLLTHHAHTVMHQCKKTNNK